jgi:hypothetical protein
MRAVAFAVVLLPVMTPAAGQDRLARNRRDEIMEQFDSLVFDRSEIVGDFGYRRNWWIGRALGCRP